MSDAQLSFRKSANIDRVTDKRKDSLFRLVDTDGSGTIDAQEFAVLYDAIKKDLAEELEKEAALAKEASSAKRRFKMLLLFVAVLVSFLAASVAANFAVIFTVVDQAITTTTTSTGILEVKGSDTIAKTATATQDVPLIVAPALDLETLRQVKSLAVKYQDRSNLYHHAKGEEIEASFTVVAVRKHNATFVEFITDGQTEVVQALNGKASLVRYPTAANGLTEPLEMEICAANATCSAFRASGIDLDAAMDVAENSLVEAGFLSNGRRLQVTYTCDSSSPWTHVDYCGFSYKTMAFVNSPPGCSITAYGQTTTLASVDKIMYFYKDNGYADKHIVFIFHGKWGTVDSMWTALCQDGWYNSGTGEVEDLGLCPLIKDEPGMENLVFAWVNSVLVDSGTLMPGAPGWSRKVEESDYAESESALATILCGLDRGPLGTGTYMYTFTNCYRGNGIFGGVASNYARAMVVGFSDGGGFGVYLHWYNSYLFSMVHAIDYWALGSYNEWLVAGKFGWKVWQKLNLQIYTSCASMIMIDNPALSIFPETITPAPNTMPFAAGFGWEPSLTTTPSYTASDGSTITATKYTFTTPNCGKTMSFTVEGVTPGYAGAFALDSVWTDTTGASPVCNSDFTGSGGAVHDGMKTKSPVVADILTFKTNPYGYYSGGSQCFSQWTGNYHEDVPSSFRRLEEVKEPQPRRLEMETTTRSELEDETEGQRALSGLYNAVPPADRCLKAYPSSAVPCVIATGSRRRLFSSPSLSSYNTEKAEGFDAEVDKRVEKVPPAKRTACKAAFKKSETALSQAAQANTNIRKRARPVVWKPKRSSRDQDVYYRQ